MQDRTIKPAADPILDQAIEDALDSGDYTGLIEARRKLAEVPPNAMLRARAKAYVVELERSLCSFADRVNLGVAEFEALCEAAFRRRGRPQWARTAPPAKVEDEKTRLFRLIGDDEVRISSLTRKLAEARKSLIANRKRYNALAVVPLVSK